MSRTSGQPNPVLQFRHGGQGKACINVSAPGSNLTDASVAQRQENSLGGIAVDHLGLVFDPDLVAMVAFNRALVRDDGSIADTPQAQRLACAVQRIVRAVEQDVVFEQPWRRLDGAERLQFG